MTTFAAKARKRGTLLTALYTEAAEGRQGRILFSGEPDKVVNGDFTGRTVAPWTGGAGWQIDTIQDRATRSVPPTPAASSIQQDAPVVELVPYEVVVWITSLTAGTITPFVGGTLGTPITTTGVHFQIIISGPDGDIGCAASAAFVGSLKSIQVRPPRVTYWLEPKPVSAGQYLGGKQVKEGVTQKLRMRYYWPIHKDAYIQMHSTEGDRLFRVLDSEIVGESLELVDLFCEELERPNG